MPFIHIKSLPFEDPFNVSNILESISRDFANDTEVDIKHVHATWEFLKSGHYAMAGETLQKQPEYSHPILVDFLSPDFNDSATIEKMLESVASTLANRTNIPISNIFINHRQALSGMVFDAGKIEHW